MSRIAKDQEAKWQQIESRNYAGQCKYMLNGFWGTLEKDAELIWNWCQSFGQLDQEKHAEGNELDEFWSHKFLETLGETMTVIEMREKFRKIDADFNKHMSMVEYIMFRYGFSIPSVLTCPQGDNTEGIKKAEAMVKDAQNAVDEMTAKLEESKAAAERAKKAADSAKKAAESAKKAAEAAKVTAEASAKAAKAVADAEAEAKAALSVLQAEEKAFEDKKAALEKTKSDMSIGVVKRNKAANELDQLLSEDPLPLRKAKINQSAAVKKCERATKAAEAAKAKADADAAAAEEASKKADAAECEAVAAEKEAVAAEERAQASVAEAEKKLQEALDCLEAEKQKGGVAQGDIWWMQREITEKKKYLPASKQK